MISIKGMERGGMLKYAVVSKELVLCDVSDIEQLRSWTSSLSPKLIAILMAGAHALQGNEWYTIGFWNGFGSIVVPDLDWLGLLQERLGFLPNFVIPQHYIVSPIKTASYKTWHLLPRE